MIQHTVTKLCMESISVLLLVVPVCNSLLTVVSYVHADTGSLRHTDAHSSSSSVAAAN
jgi:hypothetical protein